LFNLLFLFNPAGGFKPATRDPPAGTFVVQSSVDQELNSMESDHPFNLREETGLESSKTLLFSTAMRNVYTSGARYSSR
jgi:hypothetical protein